MNKSFRGQIADATVDQIRLSTNNGLTGYKIVKFELFPSNPTVDNENIVKIFSVEPESGTTSTDVTFTDPTLLGVAMWTNSSTSYFHPSDIEVVFDNMIFNQDIFVSHRSSQGGNAVNYYIELEQVKLSENEATVATLKDMRASE